MPLTAVFEVATLADAVGKAAQIAPSKGSTLDRAAGILFEINMNPDEPVVIKASDLETTYRQNVGVLEVPGESLEWRLPSGLISKFLADLPMSSGSTVTIQDRDDGWLYFMSSNTKAKLRPIVAGGFPTIEPFSPDGMATVSNLPRRLSQVAWAVDKKAEGVKGGVHMSGTHLCATNGYVMAQVECVVPIENPVTAPLATVSRLLKSVPEVELRATDMHLQMMTDPDTQITCTLFADEYPDISALVEKCRTKTTVLMDRELVADAVRRMLVLGDQDRETPLTSFSLKPDKLRVMMDVHGVGMITEDLAIEGDIDFRFFATPQYIMTALDGSQRPHVRVHLGATPALPVLFVDDDGYTALVATRQVTPKSQVQAP